MFRATTLAVLFAAVLAAVVAPTLAQEEKGAKPKESPEQKLVREYLKENLPTGKWEEIKWWPAQDGRTVSDDWSGRVIRLKYRSQNDSGATSLYDEVFTITAKSKVIQHRNDHPVTANRDRIFRDQAKN